MVYDLFLKFLEVKGIGYRWPLKFCKNGASDTLIIPGGAFADDMFLVDNDFDRFQSTLSRFDDFLNGCGMSLSPPKCKFIAINTTPPRSYPPSPVKVSDAWGTLHEIPCQPCNLPIEYLGYRLIPGKTDVLSQWDIHNNMIYEKFKKTCDKLKRSAFRPTELIKIINSDLNTVVQYFFHSNFMPTDAAKLRTIEKSSHPGNSTQNNAGPSPLKVRLCLFEDLIVKLTPRRSPA